MAFRYGEDVFGGGKYGPPRDETVYLVAPVVRRLDLTAVLMGRFESEAMVLRNTARSVVIRYEAPVVRRLMATVEVTRRVEREVALRRRVEYNAER